MLAIFLKTLPFFLLIGTGWLAGRLRAFPPEATAWLTRFVFYFALSAMLFRFSATLDLAALFDLRFAAAYVAGSVVVWALVFAVSTGKTALAVIGAGLGSWLIFGAAVDLWQRAGHTPARLARLPRADWGRVVAHAGLGVVFVGVSLHLAWMVEDIRVAHIGQSFDVAGYDVLLTGVEQVPGANYDATIATVEVSRGGRPVATLHPEKRFYPVQAMPTPEAATHSGPFGDIYLALGDPQQGGGWALRTYLKPFTLWLWAGSVLMGVGGLLSLSDRRWRVAAPARRVRAVPAE